MDTQFSHGQLQPPPHAQSQTQTAAAAGHHGQTLQFHPHHHHPHQHHHQHHHHSVQDADEHSASFLQHHHHHHHQHHSNDLSGLPRVNVVDDAVFPSDLHSFQHSFEAVPQSGVVSHTTGAVVPVHASFNGVDSLPVLLNQEDLLSQPRDHAVELRQQQGTPQPPSQQQQQQQQHARKQLPRQRQQQRSAISQAQIQQPSISAAQLVNTTTSQGHYGVVAAPPRPGARAVTRIRDEALDGFAGPLSAASSMVDMETPVSAAAMDMCTPEPQRDAVEQLKKQSNSHLSTKIVLDPPNLMQWRQRLFDLEEIVIMNHDEFETYFPHVDNIYSHRSTQRYKRKPFVTHYWDCRMKGRPPGTPKSDDPNKKKRKRNARERDLCDVKIKITEYSAGPSISELMLASNLGGDVLARVHGHPFWTLQRVNGNGTNGTGDGKPATHKHTLDKSDEIKRNSIQRLVAARDKTTKKPQKPSAALAAATMPAWSQGARKPTGAAASTARKHAKAHEMKLYSACFCPFSQRVWIALEAKGLAYQYCEMDPFSSPKPTHLLEANPRGQVPAIRHGEWACGESTVILEYLEDLDDTVVLYPTDPRLKATCRLWVEFINTTVVPAFYGLLKATEQPARGEAAKILQHHINSIVQAADEKGPYFLGHQMCLVDIHFAPFALRLLRIIDPFRSWIPSLPDPRLHRWIMAMEDNPHVRNTMSSNNLYINTLDLLVQGAKP